jgi:outer membrane lipoprotein-sorting protein
MKRHFSLLTAGILALGLLPAGAQMGGGAGVMQYGNGMEKLFGSNQTFSAMMRMQVQNDANGSPTTVSGKMAFDRGNSRFEMDIGGLPPAVASQMKTMGLDHMVAISQHDKNAVYVIYPHAQSYAQMTPPASVKASNADSKLDVTALGKETVDGHPCVKNKAILTDKQGQKHEFTVWNATDLKNFPIKIAMNEQGSAITVSYQDISFSKPAASEFNPPTGYTKYSSPQELMQGVMMKHMGGGAGMPPGGH